VFPDPPQHLRVGAVLADHLNRVVGFAQAHSRVTTTGDGCNTRKMTFSRKSRLQVTPSPGACAAMRGGELPQLVVDERHEGDNRLAVASRGRLEEAGHIGADR
jgi:hypothetical protein